MPLKPAHKEFIDAILENFFDLPTEAKPLKEVTNKIKKAFSAELKEEDGDLFLLQECITTPQKKFLQLEVLIEGSDFTNQEVQDYIISFTTKQLMMAAKKADIEFKNLEWDEIEITNNLPWHQFLFEKFKSDHTGIPTNYNALSPSTIALPEGVIYTVRFSESYTLFEVTVNIPEAKPDIIILPVAIPEDSDEEYLNREEAPELIQQAIPMIGKKVIEHLKLSTSTPPSGNLLKLLTFEYFFNYLKEDATRIKELTRLTAQDVNSMTHPTVINLLKNKKITVKQSRTIRSPQIIIFSNPFYYHRFQEGELTLEDILNIKQEESQNLIRPQIIRLQTDRNSPVRRLESKEAKTREVKEQKKKKITFEQAKNMTPGLRKLLDGDDDGFYLSSIENNSIPFESIEDLTQDEAATLLIPGMSKLISIGKIIFDKARNLPKRVAKLICENALLNHLVFVEKVIFIDEVSSLLALEFSESFHPDEFKKFSDNNLLREYIKEFLKLADVGLLFVEDLHCLYRNFNEIKKQPPVDFSKNAFIYESCKVNLRIRMDRVHQCDPLILHSRRPDDLMKITSLMKKIELNSIDLWSYLFSLRFLALFQVLPYDFDNIEDTMEGTKLDMQRKIARFFFSPLQFKQLTMKHFLLGLRQYLSDELENKKLKPILQKHYVVLNTEIMNATKVENEAKGTEPSGNNWFKVFENILVFAKKTLSERDQPPRKKQKTGPLSLFSEVEFSKNLVEFCENFVAFAEDLNNFEKPNVSLPEASRKRALA